MALGEFSKGTAGLLGEDGTVYGGRGRHVQRESAAGGLGRGIKIASQALSSEPRVRVGAEAGPAKYHCLACAYSGVGLYARLRDSLVELVGDTGNPVLANYMDREVPIMVCVCKLQSPGNLPILKER